MKNFKEFNIGLNGDGGANEPIELQEGIIRAIKISHIKNIKR